MSMNDVSITQLILYDSKTEEILLCAGETSLSPLIPSEPNFWRFPHIPTPSDFIHLDTHDVNKHLEYISDARAAFKTVLGEKIAPQVALVALSRSPAFGMHPMVKSLILSLEIAKSDDLSYFVSQEKNQFRKWTTVAEILSSWRSGASRYSAEVLHLARYANKSHSIQGAFSFCSNDWSADPEQVSLSWEYAPNVFAVPIASNTIMPFTKTNLVVITGDSPTDECLIIDPGASNDGSKHLLKILDQLPSKPKVVLTHHHHDHVEGLSTVLGRFPDAEVLAQENTFKRLRPGTIPAGLDLKKRLIRGPEETLHVGSTEVRLIFLPGHTDGHIVLWLPKSRCLLAGDHIVGFGSAVLDPDGGGNMKQYLESTTQLAHLNPLVAIPAHGHPVLTGAQKLLEQYIAHRLIREQAILTAWKAGNRTLDSLVSVVYKDTPEPLKSAAKRNGLLHLEKLCEDGVIEGSFVEIKSGL
eukprot:TRINITY_DN6580_c0_g1_i1.p1 TRINITY_DN6580_c0_g1~~TRINITY_DN6580_c0_g1_i1.p1  ORF type:complete len:469 (+),score=40.47 TRINITY_DN6580_c0_g1_i1:75-1481(+)